MALSLSELRTPNKAPRKKRQVSRPAQTSPQTSGRPATQATAQTSSRPEKKTAQRPWRSPATSELQLESGPSSSSQVWSFSLRQWLKAKYEASPLFYWPHPKK